MPQRRGTQSSRDSTSRQLAVMAALPLRPSQTTTQSHFQPTDDFGRAVLPDRSRFPQRSPDLLAIYAAAREALPLFGAALQEVAQQMRTKVRRFRMATSDPWVLASQQMGENGLTGGVS